MFILSHSEPIVSLTTHNKQQIVQLMIIQLNNVMGMQLNNEITREKVF